MQACVNLNTRYKDDIELEDAIHTAILTLKEGFDGKMTENNIEVTLLLDCLALTFSIDRNNW